MSSVNDIIVDLSIYIFVLVWIVQSTGYQKIKEELGFTIVKLILQNSQFYNSEINSATIPWDWELAF